MECIAHQRTAAARTGGRCRALALLLAVGARPMAAQDTSAVVRTAGDTVRRSPGLDANAIISATIARQRVWRISGAEYQYQASVQVVVHDLGKPPDSAAAVAMISQTLSNASWRSPGGYHETIVARRRTNHLNAVWSTVSVTDIANFQRDRVDIQSYSLVSPIADDALSYYRFRVADTLTVDGQRAIRLMLVPRYPTVPSFTGFVDVADSTDDVLDVDVGVNAAARFGLWRKIRYREDFAAVGNGGWLPREITFSGAAHLGLPIPRTPRRLAFEQTALFSDFRFDSTARAGSQNEVRVVVEANADRLDSTAWAAPGAVPLTEAERRSWDRADSAAQRFTGVVGRMRQSAGFGQFSVASADFFHFNRVDGAYVGAGGSWHRTTDLTLDGKLGYGTGSEAWQYRVGGVANVSASRRFWLGAWYHDETMHRPSMIPHAVDPTIDALLYERDQLDYYRERGATLSVGARLLDFTRVALQFDDQAQSTLPVVTDYSILRGTEPQRPNGFIVAGRMRTLTGSVTWDSRSLVRRYGVDTHLATANWTRITVSAEAAIPALIPDDFDFARYVLQIERHQRTSSLGVTTINALAGIATGTVPPQRYFTIDFGMRTLGFQGGGFRALGDTSFAGNRIAMISVHHDFGQLLFARSGLPLIRRLPFTFSLYAGAFAIDFVHHAPFPGDSGFQSTSRPYTEVGFGLGNLLPFFTPVNLGAQFTWQLSTQSARRFQFGLTLARP